MRIRLEKKRIGMHVYIEFGSCFCILYDQISFLSLVDGVITNERFNIPLFQKLESGVYAYTYVCG